MTLSCSFWILRSSHLEKSLYCHFSLILKVFLLLSLKKVLLYLPVFALAQFVQNMANPTALLLSSVQMLRHLELHDKADQIQNAIVNTIAEGKHRTVDLGGTSSTSDFTKAVCDHL